MVKGRWKRKIYFSGGAVLSFFNGLIPKDKRRICFFCKSGLEDNSEAFLTYLCRQNYQEEYRILCAVGDPKPYGYLKKQGVEVVTIRKSLWQLMRSKYIFCHGEMLAVMPSKNQVSLNFWHGTPLKKINRMVEKLGDYRYDFFTYVLCTSELFRDIFAESFGCERERVLVGGYPRCDYLFQNEEALSALGVDKKEYTKLFLWMPTYRRSRDGLIVDMVNDKETGGFSLFYQREDFLRLQAFLEEKNAYLLVKIHPAQDLSFLKEEWKKFSRIRFITSRELMEKQVPLYGVVREADALITDYSSVYFDYLLLDRPEGFVVEDLESYQNARGFVFEEPLKYMPGEKIHTIPEFFAFLEDCLEGKDPWKEERRKLNLQVNSCRDGRASERLCRVLGLKRKREKEGESCGRPINSK